MVEGRCRRSDNDDDDDETYRNPTDEPVAMSRSQGKNGNISTDICEQCYP